MIHGIGTDIIETSRIKNSIENYGERFLNKVFTEIERDYCELFNEKNYLHYAARFAAKEAFSKAIGTGFSQGFKLNEFSIKNDKSGEPKAILHGNLLEKYRDFKILVSLSHIEDYAVAYLIMEKSNE